MSRKGIVLAGGRGSRLFPVTLGISKQLLPVFDKPMIYYPLSTLMLAGIRSITIITAPEWSSAYRRLLGDGSQWGLELNYVAQDEPRGLAEAFILADTVVGGEPSALVLGDNLFFGQGLRPRLERAAQQQDGSTIFVHSVSNPSEFGVLSFDAEGRPHALEEKPARPRSNWAVTGVYFVDSEAAIIARSLRPSARGELEIVDLLRRYLQAGTLAVEKLGRGFAWLDTGTHRGLIEASEFVRTIETRQGFKIACLEEIALNRGWIDETMVSEAAGRMRGTEYGAYLEHLVQMSGSPQ